MRHHLRGLHLGYDTNSAVLFPETIAVREAPERFSWGGIFCDREGRPLPPRDGRRRRHLAWSCPRDVAEMVHDQKRCEEAFVLWDMGPRPHPTAMATCLRPFMIKQASRSGMYGLEELRCDLTAFKEAVKLQADGVPKARDVQYAVLFDRMFRFPVTGERVRNYEASAASCSSPTCTSTGSSAGPTTGCTSTGSAPRRSPTSCARDRDAVPRRHRPAPKLVHWFAGYELVSTYLAPHRVPSGPRVPTPST
ncbi:DUF6421 family protein [Streptomyces sp. B21-105]